LSHEYDSHDANNSNRNIQAIQLIKQWEMISERNNTSESDNNVISKQCHDTGKGRENYHEDLFIWMSVDTIQLC